MVTSPQPSPQVERVKGASPSNSLSSALWAPSPLGEGKRNEYNEGAVRLNKTKHYLFRFIIKSLSDKFICW